MKSDGALPDTGSGNPEELDRIDALVATTLLCGATIVPIMVSYEGIAVFRLPNQWAMVTAAIVAAAIASVGMLLRPGRAQEALRSARWPLTLAAAALVWTTLATLTSLDRTVSLNAFPFMFSALSIAVLSSIFLARISVAALATAIAIPVAINAVVVALQAFRIWNPWKFEYEFQRMYKNALLGNPNDVGAFLAAPATMLLGVCVASRRHRPWAIPVLLACWSGLLLSETLTATIATVAGSVVLLVLRYRKRGVVIALVALLLLACGVLAYEPLRTRIGFKVSAGANLKLDRLMSGRLESFGAAWEMFKDRPLLGLGPGTFKQHYMDYRIDLPQEWVHRVNSVYSPIDEYFREVHNDHLQILAESGLPAYVILWSAFFLVARLSFGSRRDDDEADTVARLTALPLVVVLAVAMFAGFPLQLAPSAYTFALLGGACIAWRRR